MRPANKVASSLIPSSVFFVWLALALAIIAINLVLLSHSNAAPLEIDFLVQDLPVLAIATVSFAVLRIAPVPLSSAGVWLTSNPNFIAGALALMVVVVGAVGWSLVYLRHPLSLDEFMATFDADALRHGYVAAPIAPRWRPFAPALQPLFMFIWPGSSHWSSDYLPVNAAFRALFGLFGVEFLANPIWSGLSVVCVFAIGRRLWPDRPEAALVAAVLLATSSQLLVTAMSPYAMPGHLALNLVWLWLILRDRRWSDAAATVVAFAACGLHQIVFHPLFAAPFILQFWLDRRFGRALAFTAAYALIAAFWADYWGLLLHLGGATKPAQVGAAPASLAGFLRKALDLAMAPKVPRFGLMARNLLRFVAWQNPLMIALGLGGLIPAWRQGATLRALVGGIVLTLAVVTIVLPLQGHGWGYRYLHGLLGSWCLIAALGWVRLTIATGPRAWPPRAAWAGLFACSILSLCLLLPIRAFQVRAFIAPFARSQTAIERTDADVVLIDADKSFFLADLVRNRPLLTNRPKIMNLAALDTDQIDLICKTKTVALFDRTDAIAFGVPFDPNGKFAALNSSVAERLDDAQTLSGLRQEVRDHCGDRHVASQSPGSPPA